MTSGVLSPAAESWSEQELPTEEELEAKARDLFATWGVLDRLAHVEMIWNSRLRTTAGRADMRRLQIQLNPRLLVRVPDRIDEVLGHEAAHLANFLRCGTSVAPHGPEWSALMVAVRLAPIATHDFPIEDLRPRRSFFLHLCAGCGGRQILDTARVPRACQCNPGTTTIYRAPRTDRGLQALERVLPPVLSASSSAG